MKLADTSSQLALRPHPKAKNDRLLDPNIRSNKVLSLHRWVNWIAGFSAEFVNSAIQQYLCTPKACTPTVLDPFAGVGTTNVEALRSGCNTYGFEVNAFAALAARCKLNAPALNLDHFRSVADEYRVFMQSREERIDCWSDSQQSQRTPYSGPTPVSRPPTLFRTRYPFYSQPVELKALFTIDYIRSMDDRTIQEYFYLAFCSTMISFSNYSYEPSLSSRSKLGKPLVDNAPVGAIIANKLKQILDDVAEMRSELSRLPVNPRGLIVQTSFFRALDHLAPASIDLVVTSPPYLNNYHYVRNTRPQLYWLGCVGSPRDAAQVEIQSFGKFWQTVRGKDPIELNFPCRPLESRLAELRALHPEKGIYGGSGWANYAASYFNDCQRLLELLAILLRPGSHAIVVVGNSLLQGLEFRVDEILAEMAPLHRLHVDIERIRSKRVGDSIVGTGLRQKPQNGRPELYESAVILRR